MCARTSGWPRRSWPTWTGLACARSRWWTGSSAARTRKGSTTRGRPVPCAPSGPGAIAGAGRGQGSRTSLACDDLEHVGVVPGSLLAPATEAGLGAPVSGDQVESDLTKEGEVARRRPVAHAAVIFAEGDVQHPMQCVLNAPMSADRPDQDSGIIVAACEEVADLGLDPAGAVDAPDRLHRQNRTQDRPAVQGREILD